MDEELYARGPERVVEQYQSPGGASIHRDRTEGGGAVRETIQQDHFATLIRPGDRGRSPHEQLAASPSVSVDDPDGAVGIKRDQAALRRPPRVPTLSE